MLKNKKKDFLIKEDNILYSLRKDIKISCEFFPPKNEDAKIFLLNSMKKLDHFNPVFFSVTHGVDLNYSKNTEKIVFFLKKYTNTQIVPHLTCINFTHNELKKIAQNYWKNGIKHIVALRGDIPNNFKKNKFLYAIDLIKILKNVGNFEISVAAYPEIHPESNGKLEDLINLKKKEEFGAIRAITQFFFLPDVFLKFQSNCIKNNIKIELIPGILPIRDFSQLERFSKISGINIPQDIFDVFYSLRNDKKRFRKFSIQITVNLILKLYKYGVRHFHFYTLNQSDLSIKIFRKLGIIK